MKLHLLQISSAAFGMSLLASIGLVLTQKWHGRFSLDSTQGIQKAHTCATPRVGGLAIVLGVWLACWLATDAEKSTLHPLLLSSIPAFVFGLAEDLTKKVGVMVRLLATMSSGALGWWLTDISITSVDIGFLNPVLAVGVISVAFTAFAVGGVANAINIIDGFNGLVSYFVILALLGVGAIAMNVQDTPLAVSCLVISSAVLGFGLVNWPWGKLFLGDGGSYFLGFALAWCCVLLIERHPSISAFAVLLVCIHPVTEVLLSIYRRKLRNSNLGQPDRLHLHNLVMRRVVRNRMQVGSGYANAVTGMVLPMMSLPAVFLAYAVQDNTPMAAFLCLLFILGYVALYARLVRFYWCSPLAFLFRKPMARA